MHRRGAETFGRRFMSRFLETAKGRVDLFAAVGSAYQTQPDQLN
jgi:hypothetical protein